MPGNLNTKIPNSNVCAFRLKFVSPVCKTIVGRLSIAISQQKDVSVQLESLDILGELLSRFGGLLVQFHQNLFEALQPQLQSPRLAVRKR